MFPEEATWRQLSPGIIAACLVSTRDASRQGSKEGSGLDVPACVSRRGVTGALMAEGAF